jgi:hypothetical protein
MMPVILVMAHMSCWFCPTVLLLLSAGTFEPIDDAFKITMTGAPGKGYEHTPGDQTAAQAAAAAAASQQPPPLNMPQAWDLWHHPVGRAALTFTLCCENTAAAATQPAESLFICCSSCCS